MDDAYFSHNHYSFFPVLCIAKILQTILCLFPPHTFARWKLLGLERNIQAPCACTNRWVEIIVITLMTWLPCFPVVRVRSTTLYQNMRILPNTVITEELNYLNQQEACWGLNTCVFDITSWFIFRSIQNRDICTLLMHSRRLLHHGWDILYLMRDCRD